MSSKTEAEKVLDKETIGLLEEKLEGIVKKYLNSGESHIKEAAHKISDKFHEVKDATEQSVKDNPLKTLGITFLSGAVLGWLLRR